MDESVLFWGDATEFLFAVGRELRIGRGEGKTEVRDQLSTFCFAAILCPRLTHSTYFLFFFFLFVIDFVTSD